MKGILADMKVLLTGFEPFGGRPSNQSWEVVKTFGKNCNIKVLKLNVSYNACAEPILDELKKEDFDLIIMVGETTATKDVVRIERYAFNLMDSLSSDNAGYVADERKIITGGPEAYRTSFPVKKAFMDLRDKGLPVRISNSPGTFVCNCLYFKVLDYLTSNNKDARAVFVHVPATGGSLDARDIRAIISGLMESSKKNFC